MENDFRQYVLYHYNRAAKNYDLGEFIRKGTRPKVVQKSGIQPGEIVLDACTGTGELALAFAQVGAKTIGIDIADEMLLRATEKTNGLPANWFNMDATKLKFSDNTFDVSTISLALHHMPEDTQIQVLSELARVTRHKVIVVEPHQPFNPKLHWLWKIVADVIDESEYIHQWVKQDFNQTCQKAGLEIESIEITTLAIHRITVCKPVKYGHL
jgi:ubiquinone/menaquinone biosynthesis C-methylase UbiE